MFAVTTLLVLSLAPVESIQTGLWQVAPHVRAKFDGEPLTIQKTKSRAAIIIHGLQLHPLRPEKAAKPEMHDYQEAGSALVEGLSESHDVFSWSYGQTIVLDAVAVAPGLRSAVAKLKAAGYSEIALLGHSAGGIIAKQFVDRVPNSGVTKIVIVCTPYYGSDYATINIGLPSTQVSMIKSLLPSVRTAITRVMPANDPKFEICCVIAKIRGISGDSLLSLESQWPPELQKQGIPASLVSVNHFDAMKAPQAVATIVELTRDPIVRWTPEQTAKAKAIVFGKNADDAAIKRSDVRKGSTSRFRPKQ